MCYTIIRKREKHKQEREEKEMYKIIANGLQTRIIDNGKELFWVGTEKQAIEKAKKENKDYEIITIQDLYNYYNNNH